MHLLCELFTSLIRVVLMTFMTSSLHSLDSVNQLQQKLGESQDALKGLLRRQLSLEEDIEIKTGSLHIDNNMCMKLRREHLD